MVHWVAHCTVLQDFFPPQMASMSQLHENDINVCSSVTATLWSLLIEVAPRLLPRGKWTPKHLNTEQIFFFFFVTSLLFVSGSLAWWPRVLLTWPRWWLENKQNTLASFSSRSLHAPGLLKISLSPLSSCNLRGSHSGRRQAWQTPDSGPDAMGTVCLQWYVSYCDVTYV